MRSISLAPPLALAAATLVLGCRTDFGVPEQPTAWTEVDGGRWRELVVPTEGRPGFLPIPSSWSGVAFANRLTETSMSENQMRTNGSGVALADVDGDGRVDVYLARLDGANALYRNLGNWRFDEIAGASGVDAPDRFSTGAAFADVDGDGDPDLVLTAVGGPKTLFLNRGDGVFDPAPDSGLSPDGGSMTSTLADVDGDVDLDLYISHYKAASVGGLFEPEARGNELRRLEPGEADELYLNDGAGRFRLASFTDGRFLDANGQPLERTPRDWGLAASFFDLNGDAAPDLWVNNDFPTPDRLWLNRGDGTFQAPAREALRTISGLSTSAAFSDIERDGDVDVFTADMLSRSSWKRETQQPVIRADAALPGEAESTRQVARNVLLLARGDGTYAEVARYAGVDASDGSWGSQFLDVDLDGYEDLLIVTGHVFDRPDANVAFRNRGDGTFEPAGAAWRFDQGADLSHGQAAGDLDGDGDLDVVINRQGSEALLLRNETSRPRVAIRLRGPPGNAAGIGASVRVEGKGLPPQTRQITAGGLYLSGSEPVASFAAGDASLRVEVRWPGGRRSVLPEIRPNRLYVIAHPAGAPATRTEGADVPGSPGVQGDPWFERVEGFAPVHEESAFDDAAVQPLVPERLSRPGPALAWRDLDADGDPDLMIGTGRGGVPALFRNDEGRLSPLVVDTPGAPLDQLGLVPALAADGQVRILIGVSNLEAPDPTASRRAAGVIEWVFPTSALRGRVVRPSTRAVVPGAEAATGPLLTADYDGDGRLDLFVGGGPIPAAYPRPASSRLFRGLPSGGFARDAENARRLVDAGVVRAAVFSDVDVDGDPDLVVAFDWGPVKMLLNRDGEFRDDIDRFGIPQTHARWLGLTTGDFDEDGRLDLVATSWGLNLPDRPTPTRPVIGYYGDFDRNGVLDLIEARYDPRLDAEAPLAGYERIIRAMPGIRERAPTYGAYADLTVAELLGDARREARLVRAEASEHMLFLNRGDRFDAVPLPGEAQLAPSSHAVVADFDGDGHEDLFLTQNFFPTMGETSRLDAGRGLWLRGDGQGGFEPVSGSVSGVRVYGDQRGAAAADVDGDGRVDLAVGQNGEAAHLFLNRGARPGLRVRLRGREGNPAALGAVIRVIYEDGAGPAREVKGGSGLGSFDDPVQVLGLRAVPRSLRIQWPGGPVSEVAVPPGVREVTAAYPDLGE